MIDFIDVSANARKAEAKKLDQSKNYSCSSIFGPPLYYFILNSEITVKNG